MVRYRQAMYEPLDSLHLDIPEQSWICPTVMNEPNSRWRELYYAALLELDGEKLLQSIDSAEQAIRERLSTLGRPLHDVPSDHDSELQEIQDASHALKLLRRSATKERHQTSAE